MTDVFISYSRRDKFFTQKLVDSLQAANREIWADWASIPAASDWDAEIKEGIEKTNTVLFVLSPEWIKSNECRKEMIHAVQMGKRLVPILHIMPAEGQAVPPELAKLNWVYMRESDHFDKAFKTLQDAMDTDLDWIKTHTRIQVRALEWEKKNRSASFALRGEDLTEGEQFIASGAEKSPVPTHLQSEYVLASRKEATRRQRQTLAGVTVALVISIALGVFAFFQRQSAQNNLIVAQTAQVRAENNQVLADNNAATALANEKEAIRQAQISRARELAAQSIEIRDKNFQASLLLGIESFRTWDTALSRGALLDVTNTNPQLLELRTRPSNRLTSIAISADGKKFASLVNNGVELWDIATNQQFGQLSHGVVFPDDTVFQWNNIAFDPDGKIVAATSSGWIYNDNGTSTKTGLATLWDLESQQIIIQLLTAQVGYVRSIAFSPDSEVLALGNDDGAIILWDIKNDKLIGKLSIEDTGNIDSMAFSPDGKTLAAGTAINGDVNSTIRLWDVDSQRPIVQLPLENLFASDLAFSPDGKSLASVVGVENTRMILMWDVEQQTRIGEPIISPPASLFLSVAFNLAGNIIASGSYDGTILLWNAATHKSMGQALNGHTRGVSSIVFLSATTFISGSYDNVSILWNIESSHPLAGRLSGSADSVDFSPDGKTLASAVGIGGDGNVHLWDVATRQRLHQLSTTFGYEIDTVAFSPDGTTLASGGEDGVIMLWDVVTYQPIKQLSTKSTELLFDVVFSPDGKILAAGGTDGIVTLWDMVTYKSVGELTQDIPNDTDYVGEIVFSPDGKTLAALIGGESNRMIRIWDVATSQVTGQPLVSSAGYATSIAFSPDGKTIASGSNEGLITIWDVSRQRPIGHSFSGHNGVVASVAFSPDGKILASGGYDATIILWDVETYQPLGQPLTTDGNYVFSVAFSPNGKMLASGDSLTLWNLDPQDWIEQTCNRVGRNFTRTEWVRYFPNEEYRKTCEQWDLEPEPTP